MQRFRYSTEDQIFDKLLEVVTTGHRHAHYQHTVDDAEFWNKMVTGKGHQDMIVCYRPGESDNQKRQRIRVYKPRTKYVLGRVRTQIKKSDRVDYAIDQIYYQDQDSDKKVKELRERLDCFYANNSAKDYINEKFRELNEVDANSFIMVNFHEFDSLNEKAWTYPTIVRSKAVVDFEKRNGNLQYLIFEIPTEVICQVGNEKPKKATSVMYHIAAPEYTITLEKILDNQLTDGDPREIVSVTKDGNSKPQSYYKQVFKTESKVVPAFQVGYTLDPCTNGETFTSIFNPAREILEDLINKKSELDTDLLLHGIAQKFAYVPACENEHEDYGVCNGGEYSNGKSCKKCKGTGKKQFHTSTQDIITLELAFGAGSEPESFLDLSKLIHYAEMPEYIIKMYRDLVKELESDVSTALFNVDVFKQEFNNQKTAEEIRSRNEALNNVLFEYCNNKAQKYAFIVRQTADYMDQLEGLECNFKAPSDYKLDTLDDLLTLFKKSEGAPKDVRDGILQKIHHKQNQDSPDRVAKIKARELWKPFSHMTESERMSSIDLLPEDNPQRILWLNFDRIFSDIENATELEIDDNLKTKVAFHNIKSYEIQKQIILRLVNKYKIDSPVNLRQLLNEETEVQ